MHTSLPYDKVYKKVGTLKLQWWRIKFFLRTFEKLIFSILISIISYLQIIKVICYFAYLCFTKYKNVIFYVLTSSKIADPDVFTLKLLKL